MYKRDSEFDTVKSNHIKVYNQRREEGDRERRYKLTLKRELQYYRIIRYLWRNGRADPDMGRAHTWGIDGMEDPTLTQDQEWPFK
jgi:hypothetical protein